MDRAFWHNVVANDYTPADDADVAQLTSELLSYLGSTDPALRDEIAYPTLDRWIHRGYYDARDLRELGAHVAANLSVGLGEQGKDSVFLRTFSALILYEIVSYDNEHPFLDRAEVHGWLDLALVYLAEERDLRGYVAGKGWAHAVAHTADLLMSLAMSRYLERPDLERVLEAIATKVAQPAGHVYLYDEDERLAYVVVTTLRRNLVLVSWLREWLERLSRGPSGGPWSDTYVAPDEAIARYNTRAFVRSLYLQLQLGAHPPALAPAVLPAVAATLRAIDSGFYTLA